MSTDLVDPPPRLPDLRPGDTTVVSPGTRLVRIYDRAGSHPTSPARLRHWGPSPKARFDHHAPPVGDHVDADGVTAATGYFAVEPSPPAAPPRKGMLAVDSPIVTAAAEAFQDTRTIHCSDRQGLAVMATRSSFEVLDLSSAWATRAGAGSHLATGPRPVTQAWARAIHRAHPALAGVAWTSSVHPPGRVVVLTERAADRQGDVDVGLHVDRPLDDVVSSRLLREAAGMIGYQVV